MHPRPRPRYHFAKNQISLSVIISNGDYVHDTRLRFDFENQSPGKAQVWIAKLPPIKNLDASPFQLNQRLWELRLAAVDQTQPLEVLSFTPANARDLLHPQPEPQHPPHTELLILAKRDGFTITLNHKN